MPRATTEIKEIVDPITGEITESVVKEHFKNSSELTDEEIAKLPVFNVKLVKVFSKKTKRTNYSVSVDWHKQEFMTEIYLDFVQFQSIIKSRKLDPNVAVHYFKCPVRFVEGLAKDTGIKYNAYELFLCKHFRKMGFFKYQDLILINLSELNFAYEQKSFIDLNEFGEEIKPW